MGNFLTGFFEMINEQKKSFTNCDGYSRIESRPREWLVGSLENPSEMFECRDAREWRVTTTACCRPSNLKTFPAEPHYKFIFIYGRGQHAAGWQQTDVTCSNISKVFFESNEPEEISNRRDDLC